MIENASLPPALRRYIEADQRRDIDAVVACFAADAVVVDEHQTFVGRDEIRRWRESVVAKYSYSLTVTEAEDRGGGRFRVRAHLSGDFPGGEVDLDHRFELGDDLIERFEVG